MVVVGGGGGERLCCESQFSRSIEQTVLTFRLQMLGGGGGGG